jgi:hypothetical protein
MAGKRHHSISESLWLFCFASVAFSSFVYCPLVHVYTRRQSVIVRPMQPRPATSTTFSCQLSKTLMAAVAGSFVDVGRPDIWVKPVDCGVILLLGARDVTPPGWPAAMPL